MKALSIHHPWAWLIVRPDLEGEDRTMAFQRGEIKTIEDRGWSTSRRGPVLIHAAKGMTRGCMARRARCLPLRTSSAAASSARPSSRRANG